jgi:hypothetical protein
MLLSVIILLIHVVTLAAFFIFIFVVAFVLIFVLFIASRACLI